MPNWIRNRSLSLVAAVMFLLALVGQALTGFYHYNNEQRSHGGEEITLVQYLGTGQFGEATFENWESEFLQMAMFIFLTAMLVQKGSAESRKPEDEEGGEEQGVDEPPEWHRNDPDAPWPVRYGGLPLALYKRSLSIALFLLFLVSFALHALTGAADYNEEAREHGEAVVSTLQYVGTSRFWFESLQNWQSEFLAVWAIAVLSIWLRQQGSPESKPVHAPHEQTGAE
jgi:hypothetical protein